MQQESRMAYGTADEALLTVLVMFRYGKLSSFGIFSTTLNTKKTAALCKSN